MFNHLAMFNGHPTLPTSAADSPKISATKELKYPVPEPMFRNLEELGNSRCSEGLPWFHWGIKRMVIYGDLPLTR